MASRFCRSVNLPARIGDFVQGTVASPTPAASGNVEQSVQATEPLNRRRDGCHRGGGLFGVARNVLDGTPLARDLLAGLPTFVGCPCHQQQFRSLRSAGASRREAHAGGAADDDDRFILQP